MCALDPSSDLVIAGALCTWLVLEGRLEEIAHMPFRLLRYSQFMPPGTNKGKKWTFETLCLKVIQKMLNNVWKLKVIRYF